MPAAERPRLNDPVTVVATGEAGTVIGLAEWTSPRQPTVAVEFPRPRGNVRVAWYDPEDLET